MNRVALQASSDNTWKTKDACLQVFGCLEEKLYICFLENDIVRVCFCPDGFSRMERTWIRCDENNDVPIEGLRRDDLNRFQCPHPMIQCKEEGAQTSQLVMKGNILNINVELQPKVRLSWYDIKGRCFLSDCPNGAYLYDKDSKAVYHYLCRYSTEHYYGFGETSGKLDKTGTRIVLDPKDALGYDAKNSDPLYKHHPFYITYNTALDVAYGILYDNLLPCVFDLGKEIQAIRGPYRYFQSQGGDIDYYVIYGPTIPDVLKKLADLTGYPPRVPRWCFGYMASGMCYTESPNAQQQIVNFIRQCQQHQIPWNAFHLSSGYSTDAMGRRQMFSWNPHKIPNLSDLLNICCQANIHLIPNVKPWLLTSNQYYTEAKHASLFLFQESEEKNKEPCYIPLWSSKANESENGSYLDFTNRDTFEWWVDKLSCHYLSYGIHALWNDNNEWDACELSSETALGFPLKGIGRPIQSMLMAKASRKALEQLNAKTQRPLIVSRCTCMGMQRYVSQTWSGDNYTSWKTLKYNIPMSLGMSLSGFPFVGYDTGGFYGPMVEPLLFLRWIQVSVFMPRFVIHSGWDDAGDPKRQEPWMYSTILSEVKRALQLRYQLIPYLYNLHLLATETAQPLIRPLIYHFSQDIHCVNESFTFMLGPWLLIQPIGEAENPCRVYLPKGCHWYDYYKHSWHIGGQWLEVPVCLESIPVFVRGGAMIYQSYFSYDHLFPSSRILYCYPDPWSSQHVTEETMIEDDGYYSEEKDMRLKCVMQSTRVISLRFSWHGNGPCDLSGLETLQVKIVNDERAVTIQLTEELEPWRQKIVVSTTKEN
eukprot:jgi/Galph1/1721/GphlegSOOS_G417.1